MYRTTPASATATPTTPSCPAGETTTITLVEATRVTVTEFEEPEEATEFSCPPVTETNSEGATLQLGTDCGLSYSPPSASVISISAVLGPGVNSLTGQLPTPGFARRTALLERQFSSCLAFASSTLTSTEMSTSTETVTTTIKQSDDGFTCVPFAVTNTVGAVLSLDESCSLEFSPATTTSTASSGSQKSAGVSIHSHEVNTWWIIFIGSMAFLILPIAILL